jgi:iron(III) transport system substrate-binding protein
MRVTASIVFAALALILGVPFLLRPAAKSEPGPTADRVIVITPHVKQISSEFDAAFRDWYRRTQGREVFVDWRGPFGTSEIVKLLQAQYVAAIKKGQILPDGSCAVGTIGYDIMFGGGSFDHGRLKDPRNAAAKVIVEGKETDVRVSMSVPAGFTQAQLDAWFGENKIGAQNLYDPGDASKNDPGQFWIGTALSAFGIVYNRDIIEELGIRPPPQSFESLTDPRLAGWVALADPRQSGSITTTFDAILNVKGWDEGWRTLRALTANAAYFSSSSTKPPLDVSQGESAAALAIDFYGLSQAQSIVKPGADPRSSRLGYVDPTDVFYIDADPVSILRGGPNPAVAKRFVEFCLTDEAQSLWQFPAISGPRGQSNPKTADGVTLGPRTYELRRKPIRREFYSRYGAHFMDPQDPFAKATSTRVLGWRSAIPIMMAAFAIENSEEQRAAWAALQRAMRDTDRVGPSLYAELEALFYSFPPTQLPDGRSLEFTSENFKAIKAAWDASRAEGKQARYDIAYTTYFRGVYGRIVQLERAATPAQPSPD